MESVENIGKWFSGHVVGLGKIRNFWRFQAIRVEKKKSFLLGAMLALFLGTTVAIGIWFE